MSAPPTEILVVGGARPNFVKLAPVVSALGERAPQMAVRFLHTGQHYDQAMSDGIISALGMPPPDEHLGIGSGSHGEQTAAVIVGVERAIVRRRPSLVLVAGDVNSTLGAALAAVKLNVPLAHLESGLRSGDRTMPEEINRIVVDRISDLLLVHCQEAVDNLLAEGCAAEAIALVGNTMVDSLLRLRERARAGDALGRHGVQARQYLLVTLHRPGLVDDSARLIETMASLEEGARGMTVLFPAHPRTRARLEAGGWTSDAVRLVDPLPYLDFIALQDAARLIVTDSGGVQEESSALGVPCLTYRDNTERAVTIELGTNRLLGLSPSRLRAAIAEEIAAPAGAAGAAGAAAGATGGAPIPLWDGRAADRAVDAILTFLASRAEGS